MKSALEEVCALHDVRPRGVIHLGAHVGQEIPLYLSWGVPVVWVEANAELIEQLCRNVGGNPGQTVVEAAISDKDGVYIPFYVASNGGSSSILPMKTHRDRYPEVLVEREVIVRTSTLDGLMRWHFLAPDRYDFLNMDLQGAEGLAIAGMTEQLRHLRWIYTEVSLEELYEGSILIDEFSRRMSDSGFRLAAFRQTEVGKGWGEALYVRR